MTNKFDIIVVGGGYVGLSFAGMLAQAGFKTAVIEKRQFASKKISGEPSRLLAINTYSCNVFSKNKLLKSIKAIGQNINHIRVVDYNSTAFLDFAPEEINQDNFGYMVEEHDLGNALYYQLKKNPNLTIIEGAGVDSLDVGQSHVSISLAKGKISAPIVVAADGKHSLIRALTGIEHQRHNYRQHAVVCDIAHELDHLGIAVEKFMPTGPFAILPKRGGFSSSIVWTLPEDQHDALKTLSNEEITDLIQERFGGYLGKVRIDSKLRSFKLELVVAEEYYSDRVALLGDALHAIHPLAGQGMNLSLRDANALTQLLITQRSLGLDLGSEHMLKEYRKLRETDNHLMIEATDKLNRLFSNDFIPIKLARRMGLKFVNNASPLKKAFMQYACGL